jgi:large subunit ribosomal protein L5
MASDKDQKNPAPKGPGGGKPGAERKPAGDKKPASDKKHKGVDAADDAPAGPRVEPRLLTHYKTTVASKVAEKFGLKNPMQRPRISHVVVNVNMGRHLENNKLPANVKATVVDTVQKVTGQKPVIIKSRKSVSNFKLREGAESSAMVTLRRDRMWHFLDRFINLACPRIKDFRGLKDTAFDKQGNYACGITEQGVFPEINMAEATFTHGMNINIVFTGGSKPDISRFILAELGMPFRRPDENAPKSSKK